MADRSIARPPSWKEEALFDEARRISDATARAAFLDQACGGGSELRKRIEHLLAIEHSAQAFLAQAPQPAGEPTVACDETTRVLSESPGASIGRYQLLQKIGEGGMGDVYMAEQHEPYLRKVALKIIKLGMDTRQVIARFEAERQALALMNHPNIAKVIDAGATRTGRPYFVMELVQGVPITEFCDAEKLATNERLELFIPVCQAIQHAHQKGIIHRDIKPSNVLVSWLDGKASPMVIDFGVAKAVNQRLTEKTLFTGLGQFIGTPAYVSPEQASPMGLDVDTRADIYSLGVLLYELLTGQTPFDKETLLGRGFDETRRILMEEEPPRPSTRLGTLPGDQQADVAGRRQTDPRRLESSLRGDIDWIVMKAIEKDRNRRYDSAASLAEEVRHFLQGDTVSAAKPSTGYRLGKFIRRHRTSVAFVGILIGLLSMGVIVSTWLAVEATRAREAAGKAARDSMKVAGFFDYMLGSITPVRAQGKDTALLRDILFETGRRVGEELKDQPELAFTIRSTIGRTYIAIGGSPQAETVLRETLALARDQFGPTHTNVAATLVDLALTLQRLGKNKDAKRAAQEAAKICEQTSGPSHPLTVSALHRLGSVLTFLDEYPEAQAALTRALDTGRTLLGPESPEVLYAERDLAVLLYRQGQLEKMEPLILHVLNARRSLNGADHPDTLKALELVALLRQDQGRFAEAAESHAELLETKRRILTVNHPDTLTTMDNLAIVYGFQGRYAEAERLCREAISRANHLIGPESRNTLAFNSNLAEYVRNLGRYSEAEKMFTDLVAVQERALDPGDPNRAETLSGLATLYVLQGDLAKAESWARKSVEARRATMPADHPSVADALSHLALVLIKQRKFKEAEPLARECLEIGARARRGDWRLFVAQSQLGACLAGLGRAAEAEPLLAAAFNGLKNLRDRIPAIDRRRVVEAAEWSAVRDEHSKNTSGATEAQLDLARWKDWAGIDDPRTPP